MEEAEAEAEAVDGNGVWVGTFDSVDAVTVTVGVTVVSATTVGVKACFSFDAAEEAEVDGADESFLRGALTLRASARRAVLSQTSEICCVKFPAARRAVSDGGESGDKRAKWYAE